MFTIYLPFTLKFKRGVACVAVSVLSPHVTLKGAVVALHQTGADGTKDQLCQNARQSLYTCIFLICEYNLSLAMAVSMQNCSGVFYYLVIVELLLTQTCWTSPNPFDLQRRVRRPLC